MSDQRDHNSTTCREKIVPQNSVVPTFSEKSSPFLTDYEHAVAIAYSLREENAKLLSEFMKLKAENARLCESGRKLGEICLKDREGMATLRSENKALREENTRLLTTVNTRNNTFSKSTDIIVHTKGLQAAVDALNKDRDMLQPLVAVGVATRLRFLERGKANAEGLTPEHAETFPEIVAQGNHAGHCVNVLADTTLLKAKMFDPKHEASLSAIFKKLYLQSSTNVHENTPQIHIRILNLLATLTANYTPPTPGQNEVLEKRWGDLGGALKEYGASLPLVEGLPSWEDLAMATNFDGNKEVYDLVVRLEKIGGDIIIIESSAGARVVEKE